MTKGCFEIQEIYCASLALNDLDSENIALGSLCDITRMEPLPDFVLNWIKDTTGIPPSNIGWNYQGLKD